MAVFVSSFYFHGSFHSLTTGYLVFLKPAGSFDHSEPNLLFFDCFHQSWAMVLKEEFKKWQSLISINANEEGNFSLTKSPRKVANYR